jgi:hypothetical protein
VLLIITAGSVVVRNGAVETVGGRGPHHERGAAADPG